MRFFWYLFWQLMSVCCRNCLSVHVRLLGCGRVKVKEVKSGKMKGCYSHLHQQLQTTRLDQYVQPPASPVVLLGSQPLKNMVTLVLCLSIQICSTMLLQKRKWATFLRRKWVSEHFNIRWAVCTDDRRRLCVCLCVFLTISVELPR